MANVMIVDDDAMMVTLLRTLLELDGFAVTMVSSGNEVIPRAEQTQPDLIMMDYHLGDIYGVEVLKQIRVHKTLKHLPIVIASGMNVEMEVLSAGANAFIVKPFEPDQLAPLFKRLING